MSAKMSSGKYTVASLFSGCGGFDRGFQSEGFRAVGAYDLNASAVKIFNRNVEPVALTCDLANFTPLIDCDVLLAGSPCQGFSTSGKRDFDDPRNNLLLRAGEIALAIRPKVFLLENVPAAISGRHGSRWERVEDGLKGAGYNVQRVIAEGPSSGVPQVRKRLFLLAWLGNDTVRCEPPKHAAPSIAEALAGIGDAPDHQPVPLASGSRERRIAVHIGAGQKLCNVRVSPAAVHTWQIPEVFGETSGDEREVLGAIVRLRRRNRRRNFGDADPIEPEKVCEFMMRCCHAEIARLVDIGYLRRLEDLIDLKHTYNGKYRRLSPDRPSPTVDTHFGDPSLFLHPTEHRGLTPREAARIQGFDDAFDFGESRAQAFKMIGNAVPPPMARRLASFIRDAVMPVTV